MRKLVCYAIMIIAAGTGNAYAQKNVDLSFIVSVKDAASHLYHIHFVGKGLNKEEVEFKLSEWTPGYYQLLHYAENVSGFHATGSAGDTLVWNKVSANSWKVQSKSNSTIVLDYDVRAPRAFVAANYVDAERGYISPAGVFVYPADLLKHPVTVTVIPYAGWTMVATGLENVKGDLNSFIAPDYDVLYDSPILMGKLESFPSFTVNNIPHYFIAYKPGEFDKNRFMNDMQKIVTTASGIICDIPYDHYSFLAIGPGGGGIEHLNSASVSFEGSRMYSSKESMVRIYHFLAHEYFHHYNVKRIRPIELGPFDYDKGSRTKMLWLSEGITVYYEYLVVKRAGFTDATELLQTFSNSIKDYENKPGRNFQTPADASYTTWEDGPFGRTGDDVNKTISPYDKGPALGILLDFKIRHETKNKKSLDNLMQLLYRKYYKEKGRGFTEKEFRDEAEKLAGSSLADFFDYIYTLKPVDYPTYLQYAGLTIDTTTHNVPGPWSGIAIRNRNDSIFISSVDWQSPAWDAGIRQRSVILKINGNNASEKLFRDIMNGAKDGDKIRIGYIAGGVLKEAEITIATKKERSYSIKPLANPGALQLSILKDWLGEK
ncbi:MAG: family metallopeptidase [Sediminibacterium sp.]|nr:family metallopeptidase [Sediminibacterium sp.]